MTPGLSSSLSSIGALRKRDPQHIYFRVVGDFHRIAFQYFLIYSFCKQSQPSPVSPLHSPSRPRDIPSDRSRSSIDNTSRRDVPVHSIADSAKRIPPPSRECSGAQFPHGHGRTNGNSLHPVAILHIKRHLSRRDEAAAEMAGSRVS